MYTLDITVPPASEPLSVETLQTYLKLNTTTENSLLSGFITAARQRFEREAQIGLITQTIVESIEFPPPYITPIMYGPIQSISSVTYYDQNNDLQTASGYNTDLVTGGMGRIWWPNGQPNMSSQVRPVMQITAIAGFGSSASNVPQEIVQAIMMLCGHWFFNRGAYGDSMSDTPAGWEDAVSKYRLGVFGQWGLDRRRRRSMYGNPGWPSAVWGGDYYGWW